MKMPDTSDRLLHVPSVTPRCRILVVGVGGAGCNSVARMADTWKDGPPVIAMNTDKQNLASCTASRCMVIGEKTTRGLGAARDVGIGRLAAEESLDAIQEAIGNVDILFLVVGLGGGTGTGAAPVIAQAARKQGSITICFATLPFHFEGERRKQQAEDGLRTLQGVADTVICLPNERLLELVGENSGFESAFRKSDEIVASGIHALWSMLAHCGAINLDVADVRQLAEHSGGSCTFCHCEAEGPARVATVLQRVFDSPMLERGRLLADAAGLLVNVTAGPDLMLADVHGLMGQITAKARSNAHVFFGAALDSSWKNKIALTILVTENWLADHKASREDAARAAAATSADRVVVSEPQGGMRPASKPASSKETQALLPLGEMTDKGRRFDGVEPTILDGENLDIPTYLRRGIKLSFEQ